MAQKDAVHDAVKNYYGKTLKQTSDLDVDVSKCSGVINSRPVKEALASVHEDVSKRYYGCGLVIPDKLENMSVLDLGSGSGRDCFAVSKLVGPNGHVTGIDMTDEQLDIARKYVDYHTEAFGYSKPNVQFVKGYIEKLTEAGLEKNSFDVIISNCVINLSPDKRAVLTEAYKTLKVGGELYFSDAYADRDLPDSVRQDKVLWGECIAGALWWKDLYKLAEEIGFSIPRLVTVYPLSVDREEFKQAVGDAQFVSATFRLFKLPETRESSKRVSYKGGISGCGKELTFDHLLKFQTGEMKEIDPETATILASSRFGESFEFQPVVEQTDARCEPLAMAQTNPFEYLTTLKSMG